MAVYAPVDVPKSLLDQIRALQERRVSALALTEHYLNAIATENPKLNAYSFVATESALEQARESDARRARGAPLSALDGIAIAVKDNIDVAGMPCTAGMATRRTLIASADAHVVANLRQAGAVILGKLSLHEGALGADNDNPHYGRCHNPRRLGFTPGGSSGGSAAAVAASLCAASLGTDTMGSVRIPAAYCGVVGFKPSYGQLSQRGLVPACPRLDHVGVLTQSTEDLAALYPVLAGADASDPYSHWQAQAAFEFDIATLRFGVLNELDAHGVEAPVAQVFDTATSRLRALGLRCDVVDLRGWNFGQDRRAGLLATESAMAHFHAADLAARPDQFSPALLAMLRFAQSKSAPDLAAALQRVEEAGLRARNLFSRFGVDVLLTPTTPQTAFAFGQAAPANQADLTSIANFAGLPAISIPCGETEGLPVGMQLIGTPGSDLQLIALAAKLEHALR